MSARWPRWGGVVGALRWAPGPRGGPPVGAGGGRGGPAQRRRPGQGHTAPGADSLAGPAHKVSPPRPGRAASVSPGRAGAWPEARVCGPGPVTCGRRRRASPPCPAGWSSSRPRSRSPSRASAAAPHQAPAVASPRRAPSGTAPRGGRAATRLRDVGAGPAAPVRQDGGARPPPRAPARPPGPRRARGIGTGWAQPAARGVGGRRGHPGPAAPYGDMAQRPSVRQDGRADGPYARRADASARGRAAPARQLTCPGGQL